MSEKIKEIINTPQVPEELKPENIPALINEKGKQKKETKKISNITRIISAIAACAVIITGVAVSIPKTQKVKIYAPSTQINAAETDFVALKSYDEIYAQMQKNERRKSIGDSISDFFDRNKNYDYTNGIVFEEAVFDSVETNVEIGASNNQNVDIYDTISQVEGIAEADIIKANSKGIFYINYGELLSIPFDNQSGKFGDVTKIDIASNIDASENNGLFIEDMYICDDSLILIIEINRDYNKVFTGTVIYDISSGIPIFSDSSFQSGSYSTSRMNGNILYLISNQYTNYYSIDGRKDYEAYIPSVGDTTNDVECVDPGHIFIPEEWENESTSVGFVNISGIDINNPDEPVSIISVAGYTGEIFCSNDNIYIQYNKPYVYGSNDAETSITRFSIENGVIEPAASGCVSGYVLNQFSMDEYNGYFRVATTTNYNETSNNLYVMDMDMNVVGSVTGFAKTESIKSVTFNGDTAYVVTYERTDPLFSIDLSEPSSPEIMDEFKISGYSTFLRRWNEELLLGFGVDTNDNAIEVGVKLVMFNTSDNGNLEECGIYRMSGSYYHAVYSPAVYDRKALLIDSQKNLIGFPVDNFNSYYEGYEETFDYSQEYTYKVFSYENGKFIEKLSIQSDKAYGSEFIRGIYIGDFLCVFSNTEAISARLDNGTVTDRADITGKQ